MGFTLNRHMMKIYQYITQLPNELEVVLRCQLLCIGLGFIDRFS